MATLSELIQTREVLSARIRELRRQQREIDQAPATSGGRGGRLSPEEEALANQRFRLSQEQQALERQRDAIDAQIQSVAPNAPAQAEFLGRDDQNGGFAYRNQQTGERFFSRTPPTADQQTRFNAANPPPPQPVVSTGNTVAAAQQANDQGANIQAPETPSTKIDDSGNINDATPATSVPSNADPSQPAPAEALPAPGKLPGGVVAQADGADTNIDTSQTPRPALQVSSNNLVTPDENTNLVSYVYRAVAVTSVFRQGKFTQDIDGAQIFFNLPPRQQNNVDLGRQTPTQQSSVAVAAGQSNVRNDPRAAPNTTVGALAATPGVQSSNQPGVATSGDTSQRSSGLTSVLDSRNGGASTTSPLGSDSAGGFEVPGDPYSALVTTPPTTGSAGSSTNVAPLPSNPAAATASSSLTQETQAEISALEQQVFTLSKAVENVNQRIARNEGNAQDNQAMLSFYQTNIRRVQARLAVLRQQLLSGTIDLDVSKPITVPQQGVKEY